MLLMSRPPRSRWVYYVAFKIAEPLRQATGGVERHINCSATLSIRFLTREIRSTVRSPAAPNMQPSDVPGDGVALEVGDVGRQQRRAEGPPLMTDHPALTTTRRSAANSRLRWATRRFTSPSGEEHFGPKLSTITVIVG
jgi:hypothetical protein